MTGSGRTRKCLDAQRLVRFPSASRCRRRRDNGQLRAEADIAMARAVSVLLAAMSMASHRQMSFRPLGGGLLRNVWYRAFIGTTFPSWIWGACHEIAVKLYCAFSRGCLVNCLGVRPGSVANPDRFNQTASQHHGRCAE